ncbi:MAG: TetR/AcrR family transcriptional regulator [Gemmatimonadota bacterium]|nr:TetR/AcrR family transcriptional regulator [Gemmatimonadota bacterium]
MMATGGPIWESRPGELALPVVHERGKQTLGRLLDAAEQMLDFVGLEGATVPAIAAGAGVSVGNVYKRFPNKDTLLRAVYERFFSDLLAANQFALDPAKWVDTPTIELVTTLVAGIVEDYRTRRSLIRALLLYAATHSDSGYREHAEKLRMKRFQLFEAVLRDRRKDIGHPHPERAIRFVAGLIGHALESSVVSEPGARDMLSSGSETAAELAKMVVGYLRVKGTERPRAVSHSRKSAS